MTDAVVRQLRGRSRDRSRVLLVLICLAQFMVVLDISIVNVALVSIRDGLHFSTTGLQWVVSAYTVTFAGFLLLGGRAADLLGRRRVFMAGIALFVVSSLALMGIPDWMAVSVVQRLPKDSGGYSPRRYSRAT